jgi:hypothetical protein
MRYYVIKVKNGREWNPLMVVRMRPALLSEYLDVLHGRKQMRGVGHQKIADSSVQQATEEVMADYEYCYEFDGNRLRFVRLK